MYIAYKDYIALSSLTDITGSGGFEVGAPLSNIKDRRLSVKARRTSPGDFSIRADILQKNKIGFVSILAHNMEGTSSTVTVTLYDAGVGVVIATTGPVSLPVISDGYGFPTHHHIIFDQNYTVNYIEVEFAGLPALNPEIGRLWAGPYFRPERTTAPNDFEIQCRDTSVVNTSLGNQTYADYRGRLRQINCTLSSLTETEAIGNSFSGSNPAITDPNMLDIAFLAGRAGNVIVLPVTTPNPSGSNFQVIHKLGVYGHFVEPPSLRHSALRRDGSRFYSTTFQVAEEL